MELEEGEIVLCIVDKIVGTVVFVKILTPEGEVEGSIVMSEVAPGRIRNIRDYVVPKKKIVCKILRISSNGHIDLSLRRVTQKEAKEIKDRTEQEQSYIKILSGFVGDKTESILKKIREKDTIYNFFQEAKQNPEEFERIVGKNEARKVLSILNAEKKKKTFVKKEILLSSTNSDGLRRIKDIFEGMTDIKIKYLSGGRYSLESEAGDLKSADNLLKKDLIEIEKRAKKSGMDFSIKEK